MVTSLLLVLAVGLALLLWAALRVDRGHVDPPPVVWPPPRCGGAECTQPGHDSRGEQW